MKSRQSELTIIAAVAQLLAVVLAVSALYFARDVFIPLALGLLLSFLLSPLVNRVQRAGVPNVAAVIVTATFAFILLASGFTLLGRELTTLVGELPQHKDELVQKARSLAGLTSGVGDGLDELAEEVSEAMEGKKKSEPTPKTVFQRWTDSLLPAAGDETESGPRDGATPKSAIYTHEVNNELDLASWASSAGTVLGPLATAGLATVFALFMLIHREDLRDRIIAVVSHGDYVTTTEALNEVGHRISRYLIAQTIINTSYGFALAICLVIIGLTMTDSGVFPNAVLWGVLATCLRFVPYIGPTAAAMFPLAIALSVFPGYGVFAVVLAVIVAMELLSNNVLEPWLYGASTGISAVAVIVAAVFWGWLWGPVGLLLSTPLTVCLVVLGRHVPRFRILAILLGEEVEISPSLRLYQRLLVGDQDRSLELLQKQMTETGIDQTCDDVMVPTLKRIRNDHQADRLSEADSNRLFALAGGLIDQMEYDSESQASEGEPLDFPAVVGCVSHHFSEALVLNLLRRGGAGRYQLNSIDGDTLPHEVGRQIMRVTPAVVLIVVLPKGGFPQARFLCKSIRAAGYGGPIVISALGKFKNFDRMFVKFRKVGATSVTTSFSQTRQKIVSMVASQNAVSSTVGQAERGATDNNRSCC